MTPSNLFRSSMLLSSTAKAATKTFTVRQSYASISRRTISSTRPFLSVEQNQDNNSPTQAAAAAAAAASTPTPTETETATPSPSPPTETAPSTTTTTPPTITLRQLPSRLKTGTVTSVGLMHKTVRVAQRHREWDRHIRKYYPKTTTHLVSDPRDSLREGDVIEFSSGAPRSRHVRHVVERIITPFGEDISARPPVMTREEREAERVQKRVDKLTRKAERIVSSFGEEDDGSAPPAKEDVDVVLNELMQERVGRIRSLVLERTSASS